MNAIRVSAVNHATDTTTRDYDTTFIIEAIRTGGKKLRGQVDAIRNTLQRELAQDGDYKRAKQATSELKRQLPAVLWSGTFTQRANDKLVQHSGLICADLDSLNGELSNVRGRLIQSPHVWALFTSPSGDGLKVVFRVPADATKHVGSFRAVEEHVCELTGKQIDRSCKDPARLCFLSYDSGIYHNVNAVEIRPLPEPEKPKPSFVSNGEINLSERQRIATVLLGNIEWQSETQGRCTCPGIEKHTTGNGARDCFVYLDDKPSIHCVHNSCHGVMETYNYRLRSLIAKAEYVRAETPEEESYNSLAHTEVLTDFPQPPKDAAFHGLAGDIVRRIEPHTEADPVAVLVQTLTAFGSVIGREAFATADGSRHGANLFAVVVGESSKARKGTSWNHVLRIVERADEQWRKDCIANGLASGEGLIWSVRDPISEIKPVRDKGRYTGEYETVITDQGVSDKRLCVQEGEFANVLKVMAREGNTLSPVIRSAWDTGYLRSLTKNFPARATDAHISIIGHITREELRRLLTETESANGFANRFLWVAARRSKCLPEGGDIESENLNDLVSRLRRAVEFAQTVGEIKRSDAARELWARVYPELSEGKPGLLGAITARAEAQVLRLSLIYVLLDCSVTVQLEHLKAALALWSYCERSTGWIFATRTGDTNADKIATALRGAGSKGLTRAEISKDVFQHNLGSDALNNAFQALRHSGVAYCKAEPTATKPRERWFAQARGYELYEKYELSPQHEANNSYNSLNSLAQGQKNTAFHAPDREPQPAKPEVLRI